MATAAKGKKVEEQEDSDEPKAGKKSKAKLLVLVLLLLILLGGIAGGTYYFLTKNGDAPVAGAEAEAEAKPKPKEKKAPTKPQFAPLDAFTVNLLGEENQDPQFLQVSVTLQAKDTKGVDNIKEHMPMVRNRMLMILSSKKAADVSNSKGKDKLVEEIMNELNKPFEEDDEEQHVIAVYFTTFIIQ